MHMRGPNLAAQAYILSLISPYYILEYTKYPPALKKSIKLDRNIISPSVCHEK